MRLSHKELAKMMNEKSGSKKQSEADTFLQHDAPQCYIGRLEQAVAINMLHIIEIDVCVTEKGDVAFFRADRQVNFTSSPIISATYPNND